MWRFHRSRQGGASVGDSGRSAPSRDDAAMSSLGAAQHMLRTLHSADAALIGEVREAAHRLGGTLAAMLAGQSPRQSHLFTGDLDQAAARLSVEFGDAPDLIVRRLTLGGAPGRPALLACLDGLSDSRVVSQDILRVGEHWAGAQAAGDSANQLVDTVLTVGQVGYSSTWPRLLTALARGSALLFIDGIAEVLILDTVNPPARSIGASAAEPSIKGSQEAFNEVLLTHLNQIRRRVPSPRLRFTSLTIGRYTETTVVVAYIAGLTNPAIVNAVTTRLRAIRRDYVQQIHELTPYLWERRYSLFPRARTTDRVDWAVRELLNGKVLIMVDNDPFVAAVPATIMDFYQTSQDYAFSFWETSLVRLIRLFGLGIGLYLMPLYIALSSVDPDLLPTKLVLTIAGSREGIPFPPLMEVVIMWVILEVLLEASNRLPKQLGTTIGTVGAVVVGTAIVKAGIVDDLMIVLVTLTALGFLTTPVYEMTAPWRWLFWLLVASSYFLGVLGIALTTVGIIAHLASLEDFGVPYLAPFGPLSPRDLRDSWIQAPLPSLTERPVTLHAVDVTKSGPPAAGEDRPHLESAQEQSQ